MTAFHVLENSQKQPQRKSQLNCDAPCLPVPCCMGCATWVCSDSSCRCSQGSMPLHALTPCSSGHYSPSESQDVSPMSITTVHFRMYENNAISWHLNFELWQLTTSGSAGGLGLGVFCQMYACLASHTVGPSWFTTQLSSYIFDSKLSSQIVGGISTLALSWQIDSLGTSDLQATCEPKLVHHPQKKKASMFTDYGLPHSMVAALGTL
jgi:hypothetical protein